LEECRFAAPPVVGCSFSPFNLSRLCKPDVTGSIPVRSIENPLETVSFLPANRSRDQRRLSRDACRAGRARRVARRV